MREKARRWREANPGRKQAQWQEWYAANREYNQARGRKWRKANPDRVRESKRRDERAHPERVRAAAARFREANRERLREYFREWRRRNPERARAITNDGNHRRRARLRGVPEEAIDRFVIYERDGGICWLCDLPVERGCFELDHIIPIAGGGSHTTDNVAVAHGSCNRAKGTKLVVRVPVVDIRGRKR
jgi:5-methylcytosine-specific restriction endonuclease McrA